jgi:membrane-associated phospholipid phosphatase
MALTMPPPSTHHAERAERPADRHLLEPETNARHGRPGRIATGPRAAHPAVATLAVIIGCYLLLAVTLIISGLAVTHLLVHGRVGHWDDHVNSWFAKHRTKTWTSISADLTLVADTLGVVVVAAVVTVVLLVRRWGRFALLLIIGLAIELAAFLSTTYLVARPRPHVQHLGSTPSTFSWPSGHAAATLVLYGGIALLVMMATPKLFPRMVAWIVAVALTLSVAVSRIYRGEHHPTDTMAGVVLGVGALWAAVLVIRTWGMSATRPAAAESAPTGRAQPAEESVAVGG